MSTVLCERHTVGVQRENLISKRIHCMSASSTASSPATSIPTIPELLHDKLLRAIRMLDITP